MSTPFAQINGSATERIGADQSWPLQAGPTTHLPAQDDNAATQYVQPQYAQPGYAQAEYAQAEYAQPGYDQTEYAQAEYAQAEYAQPEYAQAEYAQAEYAQPEYAQPEYAQPEYAQPQYAQQQYPPPYPPAPYYGGPQQYVDQPYVDQPYPGHQYAAPQFPPAYGTPPPPPQVWQIEEETERFVDHPGMFVPPPAAVAEHSSRRRRNVWISLFTGVTVASAVLVSGFFVLGRLSDAPASAVVGDCLARSGEGAKVVPCSDQQAAFIVLGRLDSRTQVEASMSACTGFTGTTDVYWQGREGIDARGLVLCLAPAKK